MKMGQKAVILGHFCQGEGRPTGKNSPNAQTGVERERDHQLILGGNKWGSREGPRRGWVSSVAQAVRTWGVCAVGSVGVSSASVRTQGCAQGAACLRGQGGGLGVRAVGCGGACMQRTERGVERVKCARSLGVRVQGSLCRVSIACSVRSAGAARSARRAVSVCRVCSVHNATPAPAACTAQRTCAVHAVRVQCAQLSVCARSATRAGRAQRGGAACIRTQ